MVWAQWAGVFGQSASGRRSHPPLAGQVSGWLWVRHPLGLGVPRRPQLGFGLGFHRAGAAGVC
eukprot:135909-Lingulodinium_polyedra.AAC.1